MIQSGPVWVFYNNGTLSQKQSNLSFISTIARTTVESWHSLYKVIYKKCVLEWIASTVHCWMMLLCVASKVELAPTFLTDNSAILCQSPTRQSHWNEWGDCFFVEVLSSVWTWLKGVNERTGWWLGKRGWRGSGDGVEGMLGLWGY